MPDTGHREFFVISCGMFTTAHGAVIPIEEWDGPFKSAVECVDSIAKRHVDSNAIVQLDYRIVEMRK